MKVKIVSVNTGGHPHQAGFKQHYLNPDISSEDVYIDHPESLQAMFYVDYFGLDVLVYALFDEYPTEDPKVLWLSVMNIAQTLSGVNIINMPAGDIDMTGSWLDDELHGCRFGIAIHNCGTRNCT